MTFNLIEHGTCKAILCGKTWGCVINIIYFHPTKLYGFRLRRSMPYSSSYLFQMTWEFIGSGIQSQVFHIVVKITDTILDSFIIPGFFLSIYSYTWVSGKLELPCITNFGSHPTEERIIDLSCHEFLLRYNWYSVLSSYVIQRLHISRG